jgi:hypothetical protein
MFSVPLPFYMPDRLPAIIASIPVQYGIPDVVGIPIVAGVPSFSGVPAAGCNLDVEGAFLLLSNLLMLKFLLLLASLWTPHFLVRLLLFVSVL